MTNPYRLFTLDASPRPRSRRRRAPDRRTVLLAYVNERRASLVADIDAAPNGNESDARRLADLRSRLSELDRLAAALGISDGGVWTPLPGRPERRPG